MCVLGGVIPAVEIDDFPSTLTSFDNFPSGNPFGVPAAVLVNIVDVTPVHKIYLTIGLIRFLCSAFSMDFVEGSFKKQNSSCALPLYIR